MRLALVLACACRTGTVAFDGPLRVSANGRCLTFQNGEPFDYVADTPWPLLASLDIDDTAAHWDFEGERGQARVNADGDSATRWTIPLHLRRSGPEFFEPLGVGALLEEPQPQCRQDE